MNQPENMSSPRSILGTRLMILFMVSLFLLPLGYYLYGNEVTQWSAALTIQKYEAGDTATAIDELTVLVDKSKDPVLTARLIEWLQVSGRTDEAIERCDQLGVNASFSKADCLIIQKKHQAAMAVVLSLLGSDSDGTRSAEERNALAYYRGLCMQDLDGALVDINSVIREKARVNQRRPMTFQGQVAVAAGLISRYTDQRELAVETISRRLREAEVELEAGAFDLGKRLYSILQNLVPLNEQLTLDRANLSRDRFELLQNEVVALRSVLALLLDELGQTSRSQALRWQVERSGVTCEEMLKSLPEELVLLGTLETGAMYFDTRAVVLHGLKENERASIDMDLAVLAIEVLWKSFDSEVQNSTAMIDFRRARQRTKRYVAALHNHRMEIYESLNQADRAELDRQRVIELGFQPGPDLF